VLAFKPSASTANQSTTHTPATVIATVVRYPFGISVNPSTNIAYVANADSNTVSVIDGKTNTVISNITVGRSPHSVSVNPSTNIAYVANADSNTVSVIPSVHSFTPIQAPSTTNRSTTKTPASGDSASINEGNDLLNQIITVLSAIDY
jgi:YVTN family beta-propeller protein